MIMASYFGFDVGYNCRIEHSIILLLVHRRIIDSPASPLAEKVEFGRILARRETDKYLAIGLSR